VFHYFFNWFPEVLHHLWHVIRFPSHLNFQILHLLLFLQLFLLFMINSMETYNYLFFAVSALFFGISNLLLMLSIEVLCHPDHFLHQEIQMSLILTSFSFQLLSTLHFLSNIIPQFSQLFLHFLKLFLQLSQLNLIIIYMTQRYIRYLFLFVFYH
jgi:hypothetical protein